MSTEHSFKSLADILGTTVQCSYDGKHYTDYQSFDDTAKRHAAVSVALELIKAEVSSASASSGYILDSQLSRLANYADVIQAALEINKD